MGAEKFKLTTGAVTRLSPGTAQIVVWDTQMPGFGVRVSPAGTKTYFYQRRVKGGGKERNVSLGRHGDPVLAPDGVSARSFPFGAEDARMKAAAVQAQLLAGVDPVAEAKRRKEESEANTVRNKAHMTTLQEVITHYLEHKRTKHGPLRPATKQDYQDFMDRNFAVWLNKPVAVTTRDQCLARITEISQSSASQAHKATVYLSVFLNHAREMHATEDGEYPILAVNPVARMKKIKRMNPPKPRTRRIPLGKVGAVCLELRKRAEDAPTKKSRTAADWISTILLTAWRKTESGALRWQWIDLDAKTITLPGDVTPVEGTLFAGVKNHNGVTLPLSDALHELLERRSKFEDRDPVYVFPSSSDGSPFMTDSPKGTLRAVERVVGYHVSPHDLRRTAEDIAKAVRVDPDERRQLQNHLASDVHGQSYSNNPDPEVLRPAVNAIAKYITDAAKVAEGANVVSLVDRRNVSA